MDIPVNELISAAVAIGVATLGWFQWKREKRSGRFIEDREAAYNEVWQLLEDAHLFVRQEKFDQLQFEALVTKANTLLIRKSLHITGEDRAAAANYIAALNNFGILLAQTQTSPYAMRQIAITSESAPLPPELFETFLSLTEARKAVMTRFCKAIGSDQI